MKLRTPRTAALPVMIGLSVLLAFARTVASGPPSPDLTAARMFVAAVNGAPTPGNPSGIAISVGDCLSLTLQVKHRGGGFVDVTSDPNTEFYTDPSRGHFSAGGGWCATAAEAGSEFFIYGRYSSEGQSIEDKVRVHVNPRPAPAVQLSPKSLSFGNQLVGSTSSAKSVTATNTGDAPLTIQGASLTGPDDASFAIVQGGGGGTLAPGESRTIRVTFAPTGAGPRSASLTLIDDAAGSPHTVALSGVGTNPPPPAVPGASVSPSSLSFDDQLVGSASAAQSVTLTSTGSAALQIDSIHINGPDAASFGITAGGGGGTLAPGASRTISVRFSPKAAGSRSATLTINENALGGPHTVSLSGVGIDTPPPAMPAATVAPGSFLSFGDQHVGSPGVVLTVTVISSGSAALKINSIQIVGPDAASFTIIEGGGSGTIEPGESRTIRIRFTPTTPGPHSATLTIEDNAPGSPHSVTLSGTAKKGAILILSLSRLEFGSQPVGTPSSPKSLAVTNTGDEPAAITGVNITGPDAASFGITEGAGSGALAQGASRTISVRFSPTAAGARSATLAIQNADPGNVLSVSLSGAGTSPPPPPPVPGASVSPSSLFFADQTVGGSSAAQSVTLTSTGTGALQIDSIAITGPGATSFGITEGGESGSLAPGASRTISVRSAPTVPGALSAALTITSNAPGSPHTVGLSGFGIAAVKNEVQRVAVVGEPIAATGRLAIFGADPPGPDSSVTAVRGITDDGSLFIVDYAGTALLRVPPTAGNPVEIALDTTRQELPDGVGLARLLRVEVSRNGVVAVLALRADNNRGIYRLEGRRLTLLAVLPGPRGSVEMAVGGAGQIAYVAPIGVGSLGLFLSAGGPGTELLRPGQIAANGVTVGGISDLTENDAGDLAFLVSRADGSPLAVVRRRGASFEAVAVIGQTVERGRGVGVTGALTDLRGPRIGPDGSVVFLGGGEGFTNFFIARPGRPLEPLLTGTDWSRDPATFDTDLATDGSVALRAAAGGAAQPALYLIPPTGGATLIVGGRTDIQPIERPAFGPEGRLFFLAQNSELPADRSGHAPVGLYRSRLVDGRLVLEGVATPGQPVPAPGGAATHLFSVTQRPVVSPKEIAFGILYGGSGALSVPTADLFRVPLDGTLANGELIMPEGHEEADAGRLALINSISFRGDGTLVAGGLLPGAGSLLLPTSAPAGISHAFRTQAVTPGSVVPLVTTGDLLGGGKLESALPPFVALGADRALFVARVSPVAPQPPGPSQEGLFVAGRSKQSLVTVALSPRPAAADALFTGFADTRILSLSPPSVASDARGVNVVFKALLARGGANLTGLFQWTGTGEPAAIALSDRPLAAGDTPPYDLVRWAAGKGGLAYLLARPQGGAARLFVGSGGALKPLVDPRATTVLGGSRPTDLSDFVLDGSGTVYVTGATGSGAGLYRLAQDQLAPLALQGGPVPPLVDGRGRGLVFGGQFQLAPESSRGELIFLAAVQAPGSTKALRGEFHYRQGRLETRTLENVGVAGARSLAVETIGDAFPSQSANGVALSASFSQRDGWILVRSQASPDGSSISSTVIAQEARGTLANVPRFASLDAGPLLEREGLPTRVGPVFTVSDAGDVAFLASDGKGWGIYQVQRP